MIDIQPLRCWGRTSVQTQKTISAYFTSKPILPFGFVEQRICIQVSFKLNNIALKLMKYISEDAHFFIYNQVWEMSISRHLTLNVALAIPVFMPVMFFLSVYIYFR